MTATTLLIPTTRITYEILDSLNSFFLASPEESEAVIVLDGGGSTERLEPFSYLGSRLRVVSVPENRGPAHARNLAAKEANNEVLLLIDYDVIITGQVIRNLSTVKPGEILLPSVHPQDPKTLSSRFFSDVALSPRTMEEKLMAVSACFSISKADYFIVDGFDERFKYPAGEDWDFFSRIQDHGVKLIFEREWRVFHKNPDNLKAVAKRAFGYGKKGFRKEPAQGIPLEVMPKRRNLSLPFVLLAVSLISPLRFLFFSLSIGQDLLSRLATALYLFERALISVPYWHVGPAGYFPSLSSVLKTTQSVGTGNPWPSILPISDTSLKSRSKYRFLMLFWRISFIYGVLTIGKKNNASATIEVS